MLSVLMVEESFCYLSTGHHLTTLPGPCLVLHLHPGCLWLLCCEAAHEFGDKPNNPFITFAFAFFITVLLMISHHSNVFQVSIK